MKTKVSRQKKVSSCLFFLLKTQIDQNACTGKVNASCYLLMISICFFPTYRQIHQRFGVGYSLALVLSCCIYIGCLLKVSAHM